MNEYSWQDPIALASAVNDLGEDFVFLYSSLLTDYSGRYSYLAFDPVQTINDLEELNYVTTQCGSCFGYLSYEMLLDSDLDQQSYIQIPAIWMTKFAQVIIFDHKKKVFLSNRKISVQIGKIPISNIHATSLFSNMSKGEYCQNIEKTLQAITRGDFYQANITRKFYGALQDGFNAFAIFTELARYSPAPYSAFLKLGKFRVVSSSPEMFIKLTEDGNVENNLIKGTAPRFADVRLDQLSKRNLQNSQKDKSENFMIVDLMRNDLTIGSYTDSIFVSNLYKIYSYKTVHHALSTVKSRKLPLISPIQFIKNCFPPGSITGAPKIQVMQWCRDIEKWQRGLYTGSIGWVGKNSFDLSVAIRTIIIEDNKFEFQVGGGIVYESEPEKEWRETLDKAMAMATILNLEIQELEQL